MGNSKRKWRFRESRITWDLHVHRCILWDAEVQHLWRGYRLSWCVNNPVSLAFTILWARFHSAVFLKVEITGLMTATIWATIPEWVFMKFRSSQAKQWHLTRRRCRSKLKKISKFDFCWGERERPPMPVLPHRWALCKHKLTVPPSWEVFNKPNIGPGLCIEHTQWDAVHSYLRGFRLWVSD